LYLYIVKNVVEYKDDKVLIPKKDYDKLVWQLNDFKLQLDQLKRMIFGVKSERFISESNKIQLSLFEEIIEQKEKEIEKHTIVYQREKAKKKKQKPVRTAIPAYLPRIEEVIEPENLDPNAVKIGEEVTELLEIKPSTIFVRRIVRPKYVLPKNTKTDNDTKEQNDEKEIVIAELPTLPIPKSNASASILAYILIAKFVDHLPLYRILQIFKRQELILSKSTIGGWVSKASTLLEPLYDTFKRKFLEDANYIQSDESPIKVQDREKKKTTHRGYMWVYRDPVKNLILFNYHKGRGKNVPETFFQDYNGTLQTDGYTAYKNLVTKGNITLLGCMAHARRYFEKALDNDPKRADHILLIIQKLYKIERKLREEEATPEIILDFRKKYALPILDELEQYLLNERDKVLPKSAIGIAINYTLKIFKELKEYTNDGRYEIDNNNIENAIRPLAIGRKNYLFAGSHDAAQNIAMYYSFFATCKKYDINPHTWLCDILKRIPDHKANKLEELLPQNWKSKK